MESDLYALLEVHPKASQEMISRAYRLHVSRHHPDLVPEARRPDAEARMKLLNAAYEILSDPARRAEYDRSLTGAPGDEPSAGEPPPAAPRQGATVLSAEVCVRHPRAPRVATCVKCRQSLCGSCVTRDERGLPVCTDCARPARAAVRSPLAEGRARSAARNRDPQVRRRFDIEPATVAIVVVVLVAAALFLSVSLGKQGIALSRNIRDLLGEEPPQAPITKVDQPQSSPTPVGGGASHPGPASPAGVGTSAPAASPTPGKGASQPGSVTPPDGTLAPGTGGLSPGRSPAPPVSASSPSQDPSSPTPGAAGQRDAKPSAEGQRSSPPASPQQTIGDNTQ